MLWWGLPQLRHLGRQLLVLTLRQKRQNAIVLLEKSPYTKCSEEPLPGSWKYLCTKGKSKTQNTFFIKNIKSFKLFLLGQSWKVFQGPAICVVLLSLNPSRKEGHLKISWSCFDSAFQHSGDLEKVISRSFFDVQASQGQGQVLVNMISTCGHNNERR